MPVLESTDSITPRSVLRHRSIESDADRQGKRPATMTGITPVAQRASRLRTPQTEEDGQTKPGGASTNPRPKTPPLTRTGGRRSGGLGAVLPEIGLRIVPLALVVAEERAAATRNPGQFCHASV